MKQLFIVIFAFLMIFSAIIAGDKTSFKGYLVDNQCASSMIKHPEKAYTMAKNHTKICALDEVCAQSGYGIVTHDGKYLKFDSNGDKKAHAFLEKTKKKNEIIVEVSGKYKDNLLTVNEIKDAK